MRATPLMHQLAHRHAVGQWVPAHLIFDDPTKVLHPPERTDLHMLPRLEAALGKPMSELDVVSPYFVPTEDGTRAFRAMADRGVQVRVLTNSLVGHRRAARSTRVIPSIARRCCAGGNLRLFEFKRSAAVEGSEVADKSAAASAAAPTRGCMPRPSRPIDSASSSARSTSIRVRRGSTPRWASCSTARALASHLSDLFANEFPRDQYEVRLAADGECRVGRANRSGPGDLPIVARDGRDAARVDPVFIGDADRVAAVTRGGFSRTARGARRVFDSACTPRMSDRSRSESS